ncbi:MAG: RraA family protein [bacterium]|nr:RraA family protein [bacterium]
MVNNRVYETFERPPRELVMAFEGIPVANIADEMNRLSCLDAGMRPYNHRPMLGVALTVKSVANDNLLFHKAISMAQCGDVIVVDGEGSLQHSMCGEFMYRGALSRGVEGFIVDGAIRDCEALENMDFSVYARGVQPKGPYKNGPGEINVPVSVGGVTVEPGDIIVGDYDGVVVIKPKDAAELAKRARKKFEDEQASLSKPVPVRPPYSPELKPIGPCFIDPVLEEKGVEIIHGSWRDDR